jgi:hypothetical protein
VSVGERKKERDRMRPEDKLKNRQLAVENILNGKLSFMTASRTYNVPTSTLSKALKYARENKKQIIQSTTKSITSATTTSLASSIDEATSTDTITTNVSTSNIRKRKNDDKNVVIKKSKINNEQSIEKITLESQQQPQQQREKRLRTNTNHNGNLVSSKDDQNVLFISSDLLQDTFLFNETNKQFKIKNKNSTKFNLQHLFDTFESIIIL